MWITKITFSAAIASLALLIGGPAAFAGQSQTAKETKTSTTAKSTATKPVTDSQFASEAAQGGLAEVKLGQLAKQKGISQEVKDFGKRMETDHSKADDSLKTAASTDHLTLPSSLDAKDQATYDRLSKLSGAAFDRAYARDMVRDHRVDIAAFHSEANDGKDPAIKSFATQTLPTLEDHLKMARTMLQEVSKSTSTNKTKSTSGD